MSKASGWSKGIKEFETLANAIDYAFTIHHRLIVIKPDNNDEYDYDIMIYDDFVE